MLLVSTCLGVGLPSAALAQTAGVTDNITLSTAITTPVTLDQDDTYTITSSGSVILSTNNPALNINAVTGDAGVTINNSGTIQSTADNAAARGIFSNIDVAKQNITINNLTGGLISGRSDGIRIFDSGAATALTSARIVINNSGTIQSTGGGNTATGARGIIIGALAGGTVSITNNAGGSITGNIGIDSATDSTVVNAGTISGGAGGISSGGGGGQGIRLTSSGTNTVTLKTGSTTSAYLVTDPNNNAVFFNGTGANTVNLELGAIVNGRFKGSATGTNDTVNLLAGTGAGTQLLPALLDFDFLNVQGGSWQINAVTNILGGTTIASGATLSLEDSATGGGGLRGAIVNNGTFIVNRTGTVTQTATIGTPAVTVLSPISGTGSVRVTNTGTLVISALNTYSGLTSIEAGKIRTDIDNGMSAASAVSIAAAGILDLNDGTVDPITLAATPVAHSQVIGNLSGEGLVRLGQLNAATLTIGSVGGDSTFSGTLTQLGNIVKTGSATLTLSGANTYTGTTAINGGTLALSGAGKIDTSSAVTVASGATFDVSAATAPVTVNQLSGVAGSSVALGSASLTANYTTDATFAGVLSGSGTFAKSGAGLLTLTGTNALTGPISLLGGSLLLSGSTAGGLSAATGTTFIGAGTVGGTLAMADGSTLAIGNGGVGILTTGGLQLSPTTVLTYDLGAPGVLSASDRIQVNGDLVLDGRLNASDAGGFGAGVYRLIDYTGTLTNNGLSIAALPAGFQTGQGAIQLQAGQVNLVVSSTLPNLQFWDGAGVADDGIIAGGAGSWTNAASNWTNLDGSNNSPWQSGFGVFQGAAGTVTVDDSILFTGLQFMTDGYVVAPGTGTLTTNTQDTSVRVDPGVTATISAPIGGIGGLFKQDSGTLILAGTNSFVGATNVDGGTLRLQGGAALADSVALAVASGATIAVDGAEAVGSIAGAGSLLLNDTLSAGANNASGLFSGTISGTGGLTKLGTGTLTLSGANTYTGLTTVGGGRLLLANAAAVPAAGAVQIDSGATLELGVNKSLGSISGSGNIDLGAFRLSVGAGTFSGVIGGTLTGNGLTKTGTGTLVLSGVNTYTGTTNIAGGTLALSGDGAIATSSGLNLSGADAVFDISAANGPRTVTRLQSAQSTARILLGANTLSLLNDGTALSYLGTIAGTGGITKTGTGTTTLGNTNSYTGTTTVSAGTLRAGAVDAFGSGALDVQSGATADLNGFAIHASGLTGTGTVQTGAATGGLFLTGTGSTVFGGTIAGLAGLTMQGTGTQVLSGANTYNGPTTVSSGVLALSGTGTIATSSNVALTGAGATLDISGASGPVSVNNLSGVAGSAVTLGANTLTDIASTNGSFGGVLSGSGGFTKAGAGTLTLSGTNTLTGATNVTAGTLVLSGSVAGAANVTGGATLAGAGTVGGVLSVTAGRLAPGNGGIGTLTVGGLNLGAGAILDYDFAAPGTSDRIQVNGNLTLDGTLNATDVGGFGTGVYRLIDYTGSLSDNGLLVGTLPAGFAPSQAQVQTTVGGQVNLVIGAQIPAIQFWDGANTTSNGTIDGGSGTWNLASTNWSDLNGANNNVWGGAFGVFAGQSGTVTVADAVTFTGLQFMTTGYVIADGAGSLSTSDPAANLRVDPGVTATIAEGIGGSGGIIKNDTGTLVLSGTNTYAGATRVAFGTVRVLGGSAIPVASAVTVDAGATLDLGASQTIGSLAGAGAVTLSGGTLTTNGTNASTTFSGVISGVGGLIKAGTGTLTLTGTNTYTGATTVSAGTLAGDIGNGDLAVAAGATFDQAGTTNAVATLSGAGTISLGATAFSAGAASDSTFSGAITGTGAFTKTGTGTLTLSGANTYTGLTTIAAGTLRVATASALPDTAQVTIGSAGTLALGVNETLAALNGAGTVALGTSTLSVGTGTYNGVIGGTGGLTKTGTGTLTLGGANTYTGTTTVAGGTLALAGSGSIAGSSLNLSGATSTFDASGATAPTIGGLAGVAGSRVLLGTNTLTINQTAAGTFAGVISGSGGVTKDGTATLTVSGDNTYTGLTTIANGSLRAGAAGAFAEGAYSIGSAGRLDLANFNQTIGSLSGAGTVVLGSGLLTLGDAANTTYAGIISGTGALTKIGTGTLTLSANNTYTGATSVNAGTLLVLGTMSSPVTVAAGATLGGTGRVGATTVSGTLAPGNGIGTLNVAGALTFNTGSTLAIDIAADGTGDLVAATGAVTINGGTVQVTGTGSPFANLANYTILTGSAVTGQFVGVTDNLPFLDTSLVYSPTSVVLSTVRNDISLAAIARTANQKAVATALNGALSSPITTQIINFTESQALRAYDALSGEVHATALATVSRDAAYDRRPVVERNAATSGEGPTMWLDAGIVDRTLNVSDYAPVHSVRYNIAGGFEYGMGDAGKIGIAVNYGKDNFELDTLRGKGRIGTTSIFGYGAFAAGPLSFRVGAGRGWTKVNTERSYVVGSVSDRLSARESGTQTQAFGEIAYSVPAGSMAIEPFVGAAYVDTQLDGTAEQGGISALNVAKASLKTAMATLGARVKGPLLELGKTPLLLDLEVAGDHYFDDPRAVRTMTLSGVPQSFVTGANAYDDTMVRVRLGFTTEIAGGDFGAAVLGAFSGDQKDLGARMRIRWSF